MAERSAGILLYRQRPAGPEVLLVHPGGPYWARKDDGAWSIPKGLIGPDEEPLAAALREFAEETGHRPTGACRFVGDFRQPGGKVVTVFALAGDLDLALFRSNSFTMEWPPRSGRMAEFPEADRAAWFGLAEAEQKVVKGQKPALARFREMLAE